MYKIQKVRVQFCERARKEASRWEKRHNHVLKDHFTNRQGRKEMPLSEFPSDFEDWEPKKKRGTKRV
jgi:hypothetical protein